MRILAVAALLLATATAAAAARLGPQVSAPLQQRALRVLALGDSITQGSVPSANENHPYTIQLKKRLEEEKLAKYVEVKTAAVGGAGIFAVGFHNPVTLVPFARQEIERGGYYDWVICLIGINDLLRMGKPADEVMKGLLDIYKPTLEKGSNLMAIAPLPAPGFVSKSDYKENERIKLNSEIQKAADWWNERHPEGPVFAVTDLGINGPMDFWDMSEEQRQAWLDDGLHLTTTAYDRMGDFIADALIAQLKKK